MEFLLTSRKLPSVAVEILGVLVVRHCILVLGVLRLRRRPSSWILLYQDSETLRLKNIPY